MMLSFIDKRVVLYYKAQLILAFSYLLWMDLARFFLKEIYETIVDFRKIVYY